MARIAKTDLGSAIEEMVKAKLAKANTRISEMASAMAGLRKENEKLRILDRDSERVILDQDERIDQLCEISTDKSNLLRIAREREMEDANEIAHLNKTVRDLIDDNKSLTESLAIEKATRETKLNNMRALVWKSIRRNAAIKSELEIARMEIARLTAVINGAIDDLS